MKTFGIASIFFFLFALASGQEQPKDWAQLGRYAAANKAVAPEKIIFYGNSITQGWPDSSPEFFKNNDFVGRGIGGQTSAELLVRFRSDVLALQPTAVVILAGTNDIAQNNGFITHENILGNIISMVELAEAHQIKVVLCAVLPASTFGWRPQLSPAEAIIDLNRLIKNYAESKNIPFADYHAAMKDDKNGLPKALAEDGVHPTSAGYKIMESIILPILRKVSKYEN